MSDYTFQETNEAIETPHSVDAFGAEDVFSDQYENPAENLYEAPTDVHAPRAPTQESVTVPNPAKTPEPALNHRPTPSGPIPMSQEPKSNGKFGKVIAGAAVAAAVAIGGVGYYQKNFTVPGGFTPVNTAEQAMAVPPQPPATTAVQGANGPSFNLNVTDLNGITLGGGVETVYSDNVLVSGQPQVQSWEPDTQNFGSENKEMAALLDIVGDVSQRQEKYEQSMRQLANDSALARKAATEAAAMVVAMRDKIDAIKGAVADTRAAVEASDKRIAGLTAKVDSIRTDLSKLAAAPVAAKAKPAPAETKQQASQQNVASAKPVEKSAPAPSPAQEETVLDSYVPVVITTQTAYVEHRSTGQRFLLKEGSRYKGFGRVSEIDNIKREVRGIYDGGGRWVIRMQGEK